MRMAGVVALLSTVAATAGAQTPRLLDDFRDPARWTAYASDGVDIAIQRDERALRADVDYHGGAGYAVIHRALPLTLPPNYAFRFRVRGTLPPNSIEFKLLDESGQNVWWSVHRNFVFDSGWTAIVIPRREISFAWGPAGGGVMHRVAALEIALTAGTGGKGSVWFDSLTFTVRPPVDTAWPIRAVRVTSSPGVVGARRAMDGDSTTALRLPFSRPTNLTVDLGHLRGFGAARILWAGPAPSHYLLQTSRDGRTWTSIYDVRDSDGGRDYLFTGPQETRWVRLRVTPDSAPGSSRLRELTLLPLPFGADANRVIEQMARDATPGLFPRAFTDSLGFWTVVGADGDRKEALVEESGRVEVDGAGLSIEPFLRVDDSLVTWRDVSLTDSLVNGEIPIPVVGWHRAPLALESTVWTTGPRDSSTLLVRYRVSNGGVITRSVRLLLAVRPLQVNPPSQFLNSPGGIGRIGHLAVLGDTIIADSTRIILLESPDTAGVTAFDQGDVSAWLARDEMPPHQDVEDSRRLASGVVQYQLSLAPGESRTVILAVPWHPSSEVPATGPASADSTLSSAVAEWEGKLSGFHLSGPPLVQELAQTVRASVGYILVNRDSAAIQPGSRAYARSWVRDAALTSSALLRLGVTEPVREFLEWFAPYQFRNGKVPCCVDNRGADPVPENDSHGEFIYLATEYARRTGSNTLLRRLWPHIDAAAAYMDSLRHSRMQPPWQDSLGGAFYGLMPESISHEGYSAHPEHSYWDDFWAARGFADAAVAAQRLGLPDSTHWRAVADSFRHDLLASVRQAMAAHTIGYVPGSVELGDFDATSTTIAGDPVELLDSLPSEAVRRTFEMFDSVLADRRAGRPWTAYTPYEARVVGTKVRLGWRESALNQVKDLLADRRPGGWRQWPEVIRRNARAPEFLGDLPHTWVASDFIRSVLDLFAYQAPDGALVLLAGVPLEWLQGDGIDVRIPWSSCGPVDYAARLEGDTLIVALRSAPGNVPVLLLRPPLPGTVTATVRGRPLAVTPAGIRLAGAPAEVRITSRPE